MFLVDGWQLNSLLKYGITKGEKMKKKLLSFIFAICLIVPCAIMLSACGKKSKDGGVTPPSTPTPNYEVTIDGLVYDRDTTTGSYYVKACVPEVINNIATVTVENEIEGLPVTKINNSVFYDNDTGYYKDNKIKLYISFYMYY